jgi:chemotaxis protein methyltransferase CheR
MNLTSASTQLEMTDEEYRLLRNLVYDECGIWLKDEKKSFLMNRALRRMNALNVASYYRYFKLLTDRKDKEHELLTFLDTLTINETSFFRNKPQMDVFADIVLPEIISRKRAQKDMTLKIWSAGCSTGQEPYTVAMIIRDTVMDLKNWKVTILASDLSLTALEAAERGVYSAEKMEGIEQRLVNWSFSKVAGGYKVSEELKKMVVFDYHNLMNENGAKDFDVIFCRNVLIYFDAPTQKRVIDRFYRSLLPSGYLFLGHSETLQGINDDFAFIHHNKGTAYRKKD